MEVIWTEKIKWGRGGEKNDNKNSKYKFKLKKNCEWKLKK